MDEQCVSNEPQLSVSSPKPAKTSALTRAEKAQILAMRGQSMTFRQIAAALSRSVSAVWAYAEPFESTVDLAKARLAAGAEHAAIQWSLAVEKASESGDHRPAKDLLIAVGAVKTDQQPLQVAVQVNTTTSSQRMPQELASLDDVQLEHAPRDSHE